MSEAKYAWRAYQHAVRMRTIWASLEGRRAQFFVAHYSRQVRLYQPGAIAWASQ